LQLKPGLLVTRGDSDFREISLVVALGMAGGVLRQAKDSSLFRFGPKAFATHVGPDSRENLRAQHAQTKNADHDGNENANNDQQLSSDRKAVEHFFLRLHAGVWSRKSKGRECTTRASEEAEDASHGGRLTTWLLAWPT
jgi:hypothetical protein